MKSYVIVLFVLCGVLLWSAPVQAQQTIENPMLATDTEATQVATDTDADISPYLTQTSFNGEMSINDILISIRNILVCIWGSLLIAWVSNRMRAIVFRLSNVRGKK